MVVTLLRVIHSSKRPPLHWLSLSTEVVIYTGGDSVSQIYFACSAFDVLSAYCRKAASIETLDSVASTSGKQGTAA